MKLMKKTPLLAAAAILLAASLTAPAASALCVAHGCVGVTVKVAGEGTGEIVGTAIAVVGVIVATIDDLSTDADGDSFPDAAEEVICGNDRLYEVVNLDAIPGHCVTRTDYLPPPVIAEVMALVLFVLDTADKTIDELIEDGEGLVEDVKEIVRMVYDSVDEDHDSVPDVLEPYICENVENQNLPDGECSEDNQDYTPPSLS